MSKQDKKFTSPSNKDLDKILDFVKGNLADQNHLSPQDLAAYIDVAVSSNEESAALQFPAVASHLVVCDHCLAEKNLLEMTLVAHEPDTNYQPELSFLKKPSSLWKQTGEDIWYLLESIVVEVEEAVINLKSQLIPVHLSPAPSYLTRSESNLSANSVELSIDWPQTSNVIKLLLIGTVGGAVQVLLLGIKQETSLMLDGIKASLEDFNSEEIIAPKLIKDRALNFGILQPGKYQMTIHKGGKSLEFPLEIKG